MVFHGGLSSSVLEAVEIAPGSGSANVNGGGVDMQGWDGVAFYVNVGTITGLGTYGGYAVEADASSFATPVNTVGGIFTNVAMTVPNTVVILEVWKPTKRFVRFNLMPLINTVAYSVMSVRYRRSGLLPPRATSATRLVVAEN